LAVITPIARQSVSPWQKAGAGAGHLGGSGGLRQILERPAKFVFDNADSLDGSYRTTYK